MWPGRPSMKPVLHSTFGIGKPGMVLWGLEAIKGLFEPVGVVQGASGVRLGKGPWMKGVPIF